MERLIISIISRRKTTPQRETSACGGRLSVCSMSLAADNSRSRTIQQLAEMTSEVSPPKNGKLDETSGNMPGQHHNSISPKHACELERKT